MRTKARREAELRYERENTVRFSIKLNKRTDADIIEFLDSKESKLGTIKKALRLLIEKSAENRMQFSYDYQDLIEDLEEDVEILGISTNKKIEVIRGQEVYGYAPILDYVFDYDETAKEVKTVAEVLDEMKEMNKII